ncbi:protein PSK SIMULATOR 1 [Cicer arietinum]
MVAEASWILKMGNQVSANIKQALLFETSSTRRKLGPKRLDNKKVTIGILSFEVANVMSKTIHLHKSLSESEIVKLRNEILNSEGVRNLVSSEEAYLLELVRVEKLEELNRVAGVVSRLGKKCSMPALQGFEHVYGDIVSDVIDVKELGFLVKHMEGMVRKMDRYVSATRNLYSELGVLNELEQTVKTFQLNQNEESKRDFEQKLAWQKQDVRHLKEISLWNQNFDKVVELLARTVCTI